MSQDISARLTQLRGEANRWAARGVADRIEILGRWQAEIAQRRDELVSGLAKDTGRLALSQMEVDAVISSIDRMSAWAPAVLGEAGSRPSSDPSVTLVGAPVPLGVVGVISPWNFPLQLALIDAVPALLAGCVVVVKPSEITPTFVPALRASIEAVPELAEVLAVVEGGPELGAELVRLVDAVCFTGSVKTGRLVAAAAAQRLIPAFLELGGKDAAIVTATADLEVASSAILWGSTANTGQSCMSLERVYVEASVADAFVERLVARAAEVTLAVPGPADGHLGPFIDDRQADVVAGQLAEAVAQGATIRCGGEIETHGGRRYLRPTVVTGVNHGMTLMSQETFGPVIPVQAVANVDEAIELANDTEYGLSGAVFAEPEQAEQIASRMLAGGISVNDTCLTGLLPEGEKQAFKSSGLGPSRMGPASLRRFLRQRVLLVRETPQLQPWWYGS